MNKKEKERWKELLAVEKCVSYDVHLEETRRLAGEKLTNSVRKSPLTLWGLMVKQVRFFAWKIWFLQGMVLAALCGMFFSLYGGTAARWSEWFIARFLCAGGGIIALCALPVLQRSLRYGMYELECATRFSVRGGLAAQLLFVGCGDMGMLAVLAFLALRYGAGGSVVFLFGVIPFLTAAVTVLMLWVRSKTYLSLCLPLLCAGAVLLVYEALVFVGRLFSEGIMGIGICYAVLCVCAIGRIYWKSFLQERERGLLWKLY